MAGVTAIDVQESLDDLSEQLRQAETSTAKERLQVLPWLFQAFWLYGAVEPATGEAFFLQFSHVDTVCYQRFLDEFSEAYPDSLNILQVDNGRFHGAQDLVVPQNIILLFQPPYCPELNPIERLWQHLKADLKWATLKTLEQLQTKVDQLLSELTLQVIASITGYPFILNALSALNTV